MGRYLILFTALFLMASTAAFLFLVPALPLIAVSLVLVSFALMFALGVQIGHEAGNHSRLGTNYPELKRSPSYGELGRSSSETRAA
jgi:hypothetical protein